MADPVEHIARAAVHRLAAEYGPQLAIDVEAALYARRSTQHQEQYLDPISLGSFIVSIVALAWTIYTDLKKKTPIPSTAVITQTIHIQLPNDGHLSPLQRDQIIDIIIDETIPTAENPN